MIGVREVSASAPRSRHRHLHWGATAVESTTPLAGDELLSGVGLTATRAITIGAPAAAVWPWIIQLGQGRGGFYSYDELENLVGCHLHSAERVVPEWQHLDAGDEVRLHPAVALTVARVEPGRVLVLRGAVPMGSSPAPYDFTWAFVLVDGPDGNTRLVVRERYEYLRWWASAVVEPVEVVSAVMSRRMLLSIRERVERPGVPRAG